MEYINFCLVNIVHGVIWQMEMLSDFNKLVLNEQLDMMSSLSSTIQFKWTRSFW